MEKCIFCEIIAGKIQTKFIYKDAQCVVFCDIKPNAPIHWLVVPKKHIETLNNTDRITSTHLIEVIQKLAKKHKFASSGYRVIINVEKNGGQIVKHVHFHILAGKTLGKTGLPEGGE